MRFLRSPATAAVQVYTFSAYCKRLLERDGNATGLQILDASDTVRYQLMREAMEKVNSNLRNHQATEEDEKKVFLWMTLRYYFDRVRIRMI